MSFARVNPAGWASGAKLTSTQQNTADARWPSVFDLVGGATVTGAATWASGSTLTIASGSTLAIASGATFSIAANPSLSGSMFIASGGAIEAASGGTLATLSGSTLTISSGTTATCAATLTVSGSGKVQTATGGRIVLGDNDYPQFSATRNISRAYPVAAIVMPSTFTGWTLGADGMLSTAGAATVDFYMPRAPLDGLTLASVDLYYTPTSSGDINTLAGSFAMYRRTSAITAGASIPGWTQIGGSGTVAATSLNVVNKITISPAVTVSGTDQCKFHIADLHGGTYAGGTTFHQIVLNYTASGMIMP